jgi:hypothetical protein
MRKKWYHALFCHKPRYLPGGSEEITKNFEPHGYNLGWGTNLRLLKCTAISILRILARNNKKFGL